MTGCTVAGRYLLTGMLGRGGFGTVYAGRDLQGGGEVAVKVFSRSRGVCAARGARGPHRVASSTTPTSTPCSASSGTTNTRT